MRLLPSPWLPPALHFLPANCSCGCVSSKSGSHRAERLRVAPRRVTASPARLMWGPLYRYVLLPPHLKNNHYSSIEESSMVQVPTHSDRKASPPCA